jgi:glutamyl-tRNA synthetase
VADQHLPLFGHLPVILGDDGQKLSKRRGAVAVSNYEDSGYLPEAMLNYLARLGWSHGDDELFTREQLVGWFDGSHLNKSPAQWDAAKLAWVNAQYIKQADDHRLAALVVKQLRGRGIDVSGEAALVPMCALFKDRCATTVELADWLAMYFVAPAPSGEDLAAHVTDAVKPALGALRERLANIDWDKATIQQAIKDTITEQKLKMPQLALPLRVLVCGRTQTPSIDAVLSLFERNDVLARLRTV